MHAITKAVFFCAVLACMPAIAKNPARAPSISRCDVAFVVDQFKDQFQNVKIKELKRTKNARFCQANMTQDGVRATINYRMTSAADDFAFVERGVSHKHKHDQKHKHKH